MNVSIIVVAYNEEKNIMDCINSIQRINYSYGVIEIIVVDGESNDKTKEIVNAMQKKDERIKLINNPERTIATNRNIGVKNTKFDWVAFTDADCIVPENWLELLVKNFPNMKL